LRIGTSTTEPPPLLHAYDLVDFAVGYEWSNITAELFADNAFDKRAQISSFEECGQCSQRPYYVVYRPRTIGLRFGVKFGR
jgi:outer membrane receptor protein involved in Fe transport